MRGKFSPIYSATAQGSVLVFSLIVLSFLLIASLSLASLALVDQKIASSTDYSSVSFQAADSAAELILHKIYKEAPAPSLSDLCEDIDRDSNSSTGGCACSGGILSGELHNSRYRVSFYDNDVDPLTSCSNPNWRNEVVYMKSEGRYGNTTRAIQLVLRAP